MLAWVWSVYYRVAGLLGYLIQWTQHAVDPSDTQLILRLTGTPPSSRDKLCPDGALLV